MVTETRSRPDLTLASWIAVIVLAATPLMAQNEVTITADPQVGSAPLTVTLHADLNGNVPGGGAFVESDGLVVIEGEHFTGLTASHDPAGEDWEVHQDHVGFSGTGYLQSPVIWTINGEWSTGSEASYSVDFETAGSYYVWVRRFATGSATNSAYVGMDGVQAAGHLDNTTNYGEWSWYRHHTPLQVSEGTHTIQLRRRESSYAVDRLLLTTDPLLSPQGMGPVESPQGAPLEFQWDLGDGQTATGQTVVHTYTQPGDFSASATATQGGPIGSGSVVISVGDAPAPVQTVVGLTINAPSTINVGDSAPVTVIAAYDDGSEGDVTSLVDWVNTAPDSLQINAGGEATTVTGLQAGPATIAASFGNLIASPTTVQVVSTAPPVLLALILAGPTALDVGESGWAACVGIYSDGNQVDVSGDVSWTHSAPGMVDVEPGTPATWTGMAPGSTMVTAVLDGMDSNAVAVQVTGPTLDGLSVTGPSGPLVVGNSASLTVTGHYSDGSSQDVTTHVQWSNSAPSVAQITEGAPATLTALSVGTTQITAAFLGVTSNAFGVQVEAPPVILEGLVLSGPLAPLTVGDSASLTVLGTYSDGSTQDVTAQVQWSNSAPAVAEIASGSPATLTALSAGNAAISAQLESITSNAFGVQVEAPPVILEGLVLSGPAAPLTVGDSAPLTVLGTYSDGSTQDVTAQVQWSNSAPAVVQIASGSPATMTALAAGNAAISAQLEGITSNVIGVQVDELPATLESLALSGPTTPMVGESAPLTVLGTYSDGSTQDVTAQVQWSNSAPAVVQIVAGSPATLTALAAGDAVIIAQLESVSSNVLSVMVPEPAPTIESLTLAGPSSILVGATVFISVEALLSDGTEENVTAQVTWNDPDPSVVEIVPGLPATLTALAPGTVVLTATLEGVTSNALPITVTEPALVSLELIGPTASMVIGETADLSVVAHYSDMTMGDVSADVSWTATEPGVVQVAAGASPTVTAIASGNTYLIAELEGVSSNLLSIMVESAGPPPVGIAVLMNAGGPDYLLAGETFVADTPHAGNTPGFVGGSSWTSSGPIAGTQDDPLYQQVRYGDFTFHAAVPPGDYAVELHYAEVYSPFGGGDRVFDVLIEGAVVDPALDIHAIAGSATAVVRTHFVSVVDGQIDIGWQSQVNHALVSAVEIRSIGEIPEPTLTGISIAPPNVTITEGGSAQLVVTAHYDFGPDADVTSQVEWIPSNPAVIAAPVPGQVQGVAAGQAYVTATFEGQSVQSYITVIPPSELGDAVVFVRGNNHNLWDVIPRTDTWIEDDAHADIMILQPIAPGGTVTNLTNLPAGTGAAAVTPSVTPDGQFILFAMRQGWDDFYQIYRMRLDGSDLTQLTFPPATGSAYDNMSPVIIGGNRIAFLSNRNFMYDEYGKRHQMNLYTMNFDGTEQIEHLDGLSGNYDLNVLNDGRLAFSRWDYRPLMNKVSLDNYSLWAANTDGSDLRVLWGLYFLKPRPSNNGIQDWRRVHQFPDGRLVTIGSSRIYSEQNYGAGFVAIVDPVQTVIDPYTNITPGVPEGSTEPSPAGRYLEALPLGDHHLLAVYDPGPVSTSAGPPPRWGLYIMNDDGSGLDPLLTDPDYSLAQPRIVKVRPEPPFITTSEDPELDHGVIACDDIFVTNVHQEIGSLQRVPYDSENPQANPVSVRLMEGFILKFDAFWNGGIRDTTFISDSKSTLAYRVLGEVPIHSDGSWAAKVPPNRPILIQTLNEKNQVIQAMPFWVMVGPGETRRCVGCHDPIGDEAPPLAPTNEALMASLPDATQGEVFDFQDHLTPILEQKCASCHTGPDAAFGIDLSGDRTLFRNMAYRSLGKLSPARFGQSPWQLFSYLASKERGLGGVDSFLLAMLSGDYPVGSNVLMRQRLDELHPTHASLLNDSERNIFSQWAGMATLQGNPFYRYIPQGEPDNHSYPQPDMAMWEQDVAPMLEARCGSCHNEYPSALRLPGFTVNTQHFARSASVNNETFTALLNRTGINSNFDHPEWSPILRLGLGEDGHPTVFGSPGDPDYQVLLQWIQSAQLQN